MRKSFKTFLYLSLVGVFIASCSKDDNSNGTFEIRLTDAPADYQEVLIDIQEIKVNLTSDDDEGWTTLDNVETGIYNLLDLTNGKDTLLVNQSLPAGTIHQIRLVLGDNNKVMIDSVYYDLKTPSAQQSGLKLNVQADIQSGLTYKLWLDFDAARSIVATGNGKYNLKPVIRTYTETTSGAITGVISPASARSYILAVSENNDSLGTYSDTISGKFMIPGAPEGTYVLNVDPMEGYSSTSVENVTVGIGAITPVDTIFLAMEELISEE